MDRVRVLRIIEYEGPRDWVEKTLNKAINGTKAVGPGKFIRTATIGTYLEILEANLPKVTHRCNGLYTPGFSGSEQIPCEAIYLSDGNFLGTCGEPCRWVMMKHGEGNPPWSEEDQV